MKQPRSAMPRLRTPRRSVAVVATLVVVLLAGAACSGSVTVGGSEGIISSDLEEDLSNRVTELSDAKLESMDCPAGLDAKVGATATCEMVQEGVRVTLAIKAAKVTKDKKTLGFTWKIKPGSQRLLTNRVSDAIAESFAAKTGLTLTDVTCPEPELEGTAGTVMTCQAATASGRSGSIILTVKGAEGTRVDFNWRLGDS